MAAKKKKAAPKKKAVKKAKKKIPMTGDGPPKARTQNGAGHNITAIREAIVPFMTRALRLADEKAETLEQFKSDFTGLFEETAKETGFSEKIVRREINKALRKRAEEKRDLVALSDKERDDIDAIHVAFEGTPFGKWFDGEVARPPRTEPEDAEEHAENEAAQAGEKLGGGEELDEDEEED